MARGVRITDRDRGLKSLTRRVRAGASGRAVTVGVHSGEGGAPTPGGGTVADVASIHEFGLGNHPERSFIRAWADQDRAKHDRAKKRIAEEIVRGMSFEVGIERLGLLLAAEAQKFIQDGRVSPPTEKAGGGNTTLIDTGQLVTSITHEVE